LIERIAKSFKKYDPDVRPPDVIESRFTNFFIEQGLWPDAWNGTTPFIQVAGKNFSGFDRLFIAKWWPYHRAFHYREMNPAMLYYDRREHPVVPSLALCCLAAGLGEDVVIHNAVEDARNVIRVLRHAWMNFDNVPTNYRT
jgi:hypothetical protein